MSLSKDQSIPQKFDDPGTKSKDGQVSHIFLSGEMDDAER